MRHWLGRALATHGIAPTENAIAISTIDRKVIFLSRAAIGSATRRATSLQTHHVIPHPQPSWPRD